MSTHELVEERLARWIVASSALQGLNGAPAPNPQRARANCDRAYFGLVEARIAARDDFAASRGWRSSNWFSVNQLKRGSRRRASDDTYGTPWPLWKHPSHFVDGAGTPIGIVCHVYDTWETTQRNAAALGLNVEKLSWSWYRPDFNMTSAVLFTRGTRDGSQAASPD